MKQVEYASMRPRGIPRGKLRKLERGVKRAQAASMRPRGIPRGKHAAWHKALARREELQ